MSKKNGLHYQQNFSKILSRVLDKDRKRIKGNKICAVLLDFLSKTEKDPKKLTCLDIGCSGGIIAQVIAENFKKVIAIDIDKQSLSIARKNYSKRNIIYKYDDAMHLSFEDESFDVVISSHTYEHVPNRKQLFSEIYRVLKKGGVCYFGGPNKYKIIEGHYYLPFLSWIPKPLANIYIRILINKKEYYETPLSYWRLKKLLNNFEIHDYFSKIIKDPSRFCATDMINPKIIITKFPVKLLNQISFLTPSFIWILYKNE